LAEKIVKRVLSAKSPGQGLVQIFTGDGKGKTSAALGNVIRALGHGLRVYIIFFMKGNPTRTNTLTSFPMSPYQLRHEEFVDPQKIKRADRSSGRPSPPPREALLSGNYDLVILDEVNVAAAFNLVSIDDVIRLIQDKPKNVELILTGRRADPRLVQMADLVTEMVKIKHPYDQGIPARKGIEY
jgi:cob(I)alamin adenosyltransferase